jgi:molybdopterin-binding protein
MRNAKRGTFMSVIGGYALSLVNVSYVAAMQLKGTQTKRAVWSVRIFSPLPWQWLCAE